MANQKIVLEIDTKGNLKTLDRANKKIRTLESSSSSFGGKLKAGLGLLVKFGAIAGTAVGVAGGFAVKSAMDMQMLRKSIDATLGSAEKGKKVFGELADLASKTPFHTEDLAGATDLLLQFGSSAKTVVPEIKMLGDISKGSRDKFNRLALAFGQVQAKGKLMGDDLRQLTEAGFNPLKVMADKTGKSVAQLRDDMSKGKISFEDLKDAMVVATSEGGKYYKGMETGSQVVTGLISTLTDNIGIMAREMIGLSREGDIIKGSLFEMLQNNLPRIIEGVKQFSAMAVPVIQGFFVMAIDKIKVLIGWIMQNKEMLLSFGRAILQVGQFLIKLAGQIVGVVLNAFQQNKGVVMGLVGVVMGLVGAVMDLWNKNQNWLIPTLSFLLGWILKVSLAFSGQFVFAIKAGVMAIGWIIDRVKAVINAFRTMKNAIVTAFNTMLHPVDSLINRLGALKGAVSGVMSKISGMKDSASGIVGGILDKLPGFAVGTPYVPNDMVARIHKGEAIVPASQNINNPNNRLDNTGGGTVTIQTMQVVLPNVMDYNTFKEQLANDNELAGLGLTPSLG